jgi:hypothetical protein
MLGCRTPAWPTDSHLDDWQSLSLEELKQAGTGRTRRGHPDAPGGSPDTNDLNEDSPDGATASRGWAQGWLGRGLDEAGGAVMLDIVDGGTESSGTRSTSSGTEPAERRGTACRPNGNLREGEGDQEEETPSPLRPETRSAARAVLQAWAAAAAAHALAVHIARGACRRKHGRGAERALARGFAGWRRAAHARAQALLSGVRAAAFAVRPRRAQALRRAALGALRRASELRRAGRLLVSSHRPAPPRARRAMPRAGRCAQAAPRPPPPPSIVLSGHAASLTPY